MADYVFTDEFEAGPPLGSTWANETAAVVVTPDAAFTGSYGVRQSPDGVLAGIMSIPASVIPDGHKWADINFRFRQVAHTSGNSSIVTVSNEAGADHGDLFVNYTAGGGFWWDLAAADFAQAPLTLGQWYKVRVVVGYGTATWTMRVWLDDVEQPAISTTGKTPTSIRAIHFGGFTAETNDRDFDDISVTLTDTDPEPPPRFPLDDRHELLLAGTWTDITDYVYDRDDVTITRGRSAEAQEADPAQMTLTLDNRDGRFSPRNPTSPYAGLIGRNTQIRSSLPGPTYLLLPEAATGYASAPDSAGLSITGDLDVRIDVDLVHWNLAGDLIAKASIAGGQVSWGLFTTPGSELSLAWSTDGNNIGAIIATSTLPVPAPVGGPMVVRATLDVDNGAGGWTARFWMSDSLEGPWNQVGDDVTGAGVTSIFDGTAPVNVGRNAGYGFAGQVGQVYGVRVYDGIDGTLVADPDFTAQTGGEPGFTDGQGNTWTINAPGTLDDRLYRLHGEVASWPATWRMGGHDAYVKVTASGIKRRLTQNAPPLRSALFRSIAAIDSVVSYWPFEDGDRATRVAASDGRTAPMTVSGSPQMGAYTDFTSSDPLPIAGAGRFTGQVRPHTPTGESLVRMFLFVDEPVTAETNLLRVETTGTVAVWWLALLDDGDLRTLAYDIDGVELVNSRINFFLNTLGFVVVDLQLTQVGADVEAVTRVVDFNNWDSIRDSFSWVSDTNTVTSKTFGVAKNVVIGDDGGLGNVVLGHLLVSSDIDAVFDQTGSTATDFVYYGLVARNGENPNDRMARLCFEEGVRYSTVTRGQAGNVVTLGDQGNRPMVEALEEAAGTDGGILVEPRHFLGFQYRSRASQYNQAAAITLDYGASQVAGDLVPVDDDRDTVNDLTAKREHGSSVHVEETTGPLSVQDPPDGVGRCPGEVTLSLEGDDQVADQAGWRLHLGTVDEARYPKLTVNLRSTGISGDLYDQILALDVGDRIVLTGIPDGLPPDDVSLLVQGYTETLRKMGHVITFNLLPESPWHVGQVDTSGFDRLDTSGSELAAAATSTATELVVSTTGGPAWTTGAADLPFDIFVGGERCTVTAISGTTSPQTFTVERSVNIVVKAHDAGAAVAIAEPVHVAL